MCTNPITIENKRKRFIPGVDREFITVPCGKCFECRNARRNELYVLSYFEHLQAISKGGFTQFFTTTFSDTFVPKICGRNCFSPELVKQYLMRVTTDCKRAFGTDFSFRYLVVSESDSSGVREINPHHHFLFFVQKPCDHNKFRQICKADWCYIDKSHKVQGKYPRYALGWSFGSWDNNGEINRPNGIRYVTKYVCKDMFEQDENDTFLNSLNDVKHGVPYRLYYQARKCMAFSRHSQHFGEFAIKHIMDGDSLLPEKFRTSLDYIKQYGKLFVPCDKDGAPGTINIPRSLLRTLFFTTTYRYKRVTKRDIKRCECCGIKPPKHKVQTYYIPKPDYYDYYVSKLHREIAKANELSASVPGGNNTVAPSVALGVSIFSNRLVNCKLNLDDYVNSCAHIQMVRDPIFVRDPFDGSFSYKRAPLERTDYSDLVKFAESGNPDSYINYLNVQNILFSQKQSTIPENNRKEKTYKDIKRVYESS